MTGGSADDYRRLLRALQTDALKSWFDWLRAGALSYDGKPRDFVIPGVLLRYAQELTKDLSEKADRARMTADEALTQHRDLIAWLRMATSCS